MRARFRLATVSIAAALLLACGSQAPDGVALMGATLIDGSGGPPQADAVVVVRRGKIAAVGPRSAVAIPRELPQVDLRGRWIIPGLIDAHAHVAPWALSRYLRWGVTAVRDVHGQIDSSLALRRAVNLHAVAGPRIYSAGAMLDGVPSTYAEAIAANAPADARRGVDRLVSAGTDFVKVYTRVDRPLLEAIVDEAKVFDLKVTGHLGLVDAVSAARIGIAAIEHLSGVPEAALDDPSALYAAHYRGFFPGWTAAERSWGALDSAALDRVARELARQGVVLVPTLVWHETFSRLDDPAVLHDSTLRAVPGPQQVAWNVAALIQRAGWTKTEFADFRRGRAQQDLFLRRFAAAGGRIAAGTDAANQLLVPGHSAHRELQLLVAAGLGPGDALLAATKRGAELLGADSIGMVAPGKVADLVVLTRDPLQDIRNTLAIERVMTRGRLLAADSIQAAW